MGTVVNCILHIMKNVRLSLFEDEIHLKTKNLFGGLLSNPLCSPRFLQLCFYSEDRKQVIQKVGHPPCSHPSSPSSTLISVSNTSRQRKKGQNEDREKDINLGHIASSVLPEDVRVSFPSLVPPRAHCGSVTLGLSSQ